MRADIAEVRSLTDKPFAVNHTRRPFDDEAFQATLDERPLVISLALGEPSDLVVRVHDIGVRVRSASTNGPTGTPGRRGRRIDEVLPVAEIVDGLVREAEQALGTALA